MTIRLSYLATVAVSFLLVFAGHKIAVSGLLDFHDGSQEVRKAKVQKITERDEPENSPDGFLPLQSTKIYFEAEILNGKEKGETITAVQSVGGFTEQPAEEVREGETVLLIKFAGMDQWHFNGILRTDKLLALGIIFIFFLLLFGRTKGFKTILSLGLTCGAIFAVLIPAILSGKNIYATSLLVCLYTSLMTLLVVSGLNKKSLAGILACWSGITVTAIITLIMDRVLSLTGIVDEQSHYLAHLPTGTPIDHRAIIFAGITIGAVGAIMDMAMSISTSLWETRGNANMNKFASMFRQGMNIGRDIMGTMANTLIFAYIGSSLSFVLILTVYSSNSILGLLNMELIVVNILQALVGSFGILFTMPFTAMFCSIFYRGADSLQDPALCQNKDDK